MKTIVVLGTLALVLGGCSQQQIDKAQNTIASDAPKIASDGLIYAQVEAKFATIDADSALHVAVAVHDGDVRLTGKVKSDGTEKKFTQAASQVSGVSHVNATMTVDPKLPSSGAEANDFTLATVVRANLTAQAGVNGIGLGIRAKNKVVTLTGNVPTEAIRQTVVATATKTAGVSSVVDHLHVGS